MGATRKPDVIEVVGTQHEQIKKLLTRVATDKGEALESSFCELRRLVAVHETAEEEIIYPALRAAGEEGTRLVEARTAEEAEGTKMLAKLEGMSTDSPEFMPMFEQFVDAVLHHASAEETQVFPMLRSTQKPDALVKMAKAFDLAEKAAPTHAHPHAGTSAASHLVTGPALAIMDRVRDAIHKA